MLDPRQGSTRLRTMYAPGDIDAWREFMMTPDGCVIVLTLLSAPLVFVGEGFGFFNFGYSKFADESASWKVPSRIGMFLLYFPSAVVFPLAAVLWGYGTAAWPGTDTQFHVVVGVLVTAHFSKRCLETLFLHQFSGHTNVGSTFLIMCLYLLSSLMLLFTTASRLGDEEARRAAASNGWKPCVSCGVPIFALGQVLNLYHHYLLAQLRKPHEKGYKVPQGGLFPYVCCPHYLAELVSWAGVALIMSHIAATTTLVFMTCYLTGRAHSTLRWYHDKTAKEKLDRPLPHSWKRIIPFVF